MRLPETDKGHYQHHLVGDKYESAGILSGSALTMIKAFQNLVKNVGVEIEDALANVQSSSCKSNWQRTRAGKNCPGI
jgi:N-acetylglucosamine-6-phosphate deacetylase